MFDHVGMILRFDSSNNSKKKEVYILEAVSSGVGVKKWSDLRKSFGQFYLRVVIRHIEWPRGDKALDLLGQFL